MKLIFIGNHFYMASGTLMSPIYTEDGDRSDWGFVSLALSRGESVSIRPATKEELKPYEAQLAKIKASREVDGLV